MAPRRFLLVLLCSIAETTRAYLAASDIGTRRPAAGAASIILSARPTQDFVQSAVERYENAEGEATALASVSSSCECLRDPNISQILTYPN